MAEYTLYRWLSGFEAQTGSVANWKYATIVRRLGEAAAPEEEKCGPCPDFALYTLAYALKLRKIRKKHKSGHPKSARLISAERSSLNRLGRRLAMASTGLLAPGALGFRVRRRTQPSVSVVICPVAELKGSPYQLTLSQSLYCRRIVEHTHPRESSSYWRTKSYP